MTRLLLVAAALVVALAAAGVGAGADWAVYRARKLVSGAGVGAGGFGVQPIAAVKFLW